MQMKKMNVIVHVCTILAMMGGTLAETLANIEVDDNDCPLNSLDVLLSTEVGDAVDVLARHLECRANADHNACDTTLNGQETRERAVTVLSSRDDIRACVKLTAKNPRAATQFVHQPVQMLAQDVEFLRHSLAFDRCSIDADLNANGHVVNIGFGGEAGGLEYVVQVLLEQSCDNQFPGGELECSGEVSLTNDVSCSHSGGMTDRFV